MGSLLRAKIRKDSRFKWGFLRRTSHADYVREISDLIMDRYSRRYYLFNDKAKEIVLRVSNDISSDPDKTIKAVTKDIGHGRYIDGVWEINDYNHKPFQFAEYYSRIIDRVEINVNRGRLSVEDSLISAHQEHKRKFGKFPKGSIVICDNCDKKGTVKNIQYRPSCDGWSDITKKEYVKSNGNLKGFYKEKFKNGTKSNAVLCMACWNKIRVIVKTQCEAEEIDRLKNKLNRERLKWLKSQTQAN